MIRISRARRAELQRHAHTIRRYGQRAGWTPPRIAAAIRAELPEVLPLEARRLALGWSRPQTIAEIGDLYRAAGLTPPPVTSAMLCRWEHGEVRVSDEYLDALAQLYGANPHELAESSEVPISAAINGYRPHHDPWMGGGGMPEDALAALRESVELAREAEGPAGGPLTVQQLNAAVAYYARQYSTHPPRVLATEVHRTRAIAADLLRQTQTDTTRADLRRTAGWLSALVGNLAHQLADPAAAMVHLGTAGRLGAATGDRFLTCWSLGAQAMVANAEHQHAAALDLAREAADYADTPLRRAQIHAWAELRALAGLGPQHRADAAAAMARAQDEMAAAAAEEPGRFGFDVAELRLHLAEASLQLGDHPTARRHADESIHHIPHGRPGWAAATLVLARSEAARGHDDDAKALADEVLDTTPPDRLRETSRVRLRDLVRDLGPRASELADRLRELPAVAPVRGGSAEPNGLS